MHNFDCIRLLHVSFVTTRGLWLTKYLPRFLNEFMKACLNDMNFDEQICPSDEFFVMSKSSNTEIHVCTVRGPRNSARFILPTRKMRLKSSSVFNYLTSNSSHAK
jgi:hypothetical protein